MRDDWDEPPPERPEYVAMPEVDPSPDAGIAGDGLGDEVYMIAFGTLVLAAILWWIKIWTGFAIMIGLGVMVWRIISAWAPARGAWMRFRTRYTAAVKLVWRFGSLALKKKTPEVSSEMGHIQTFLPQTAPLLSPVTLAIGIFALTAGWGGWGWFIHAPALEQKLAKAETVGAVAVGANADWQKQMDAYKRALAEANARIVAQSQAAQAGESDAFKRGQMEERRRYAGRQKQRRLEDAVQNPGVTPPDIDGFLRDIGVAPSSDPPGGSPDADSGDPAPTPPG